MSERPSVWATSFTEQNGTSGTAILDGVPHSELRFVLDGVSGYERPDAPDGN